MKLYLRWFGALNLTVSALLNAFTLCVTEYSYWISEELHSWPY